MYEDAWYSFVPETHSKKENVTSQASQHRRKESLLQQTNVSLSRTLRSRYRVNEDIQGNNQALNLHTPMLGIYEDKPLSKDPPKATLARRAKSYSDFYEIAMAYINKETNEEKAQNERDTETEELRTPLFEERYSTLEDDIVDGSLEEYQYVYASESNPANALTI